MEVYIEYVVIDNIIINFLLLSVTFAISGYTVSFRNRLFSSILGTIFVLFVPLISTVAGLMLFYRLFCGIIIVFTAKRYDRFGQFVSIYLIFVFLTFLFGGLLITGLSIFDIVYTSSGLIFLNFEIPISLFVLPIWLYSICTIKIVNFLKNRWKIAKYMYQIIINCNGKKCELKGFLDTGNSLYDIDGRPVIVMEIKTFVIMFPSFPIHKILLHQRCEENLTNSHYIEVKTVNTQEKLFAFDADYIIVKNKDKDRIFEKVCVAVSKKNFVDYNLILHRNFC